MDSEHRGSSFLGGTYLSRESVICGTIPATSPVCFPQAWGVDTAADRIDGGLTTRRAGVRMSDERTSAVVQRYLDHLAGNGPPEPVVRSLLDQAVRRLHQLCA